MLSFSLSSRIHYREKTIFMKKIFFICMLYLCSLYHIPINAIENSTIQIKIKPEVSTTEFSFIMNTLEIIMAEKAPSHLAFIQNDMQSIKKYFEQIAYNISEKEAFYSHRYIRHLYNKLCQTIKNIAIEIEQTKDLKPWHLRWIAKQGRDLSTNIEKRRLSIKNNKIDRKTMVLIYHFSRIINNRIMRSFQPYLGTNLEKWLDKGYEIKDFYLENWYWTIPGSILLATTGIGIINQQRNIVSPKKWNLNEDSKSQKGLWGGWISFASGLLGYAFLTTTPPDKPTGMVLPEKTTANPTPIKALEGNIKNLPFTRKYKRRLITQLPCLPQKGYTCGLHTLYNLGTLKEIFEKKCTPEAFLNQTQFDRFFSRITNFMYNDHLQKKTDSHLCKLTNDHKKKDAICKIAATEKETKKAKKAVRFALQNCMTNIDQLKTIKDNPRITITNWQQIVVLDNIQEIQCYVQDPDYGSDAGGGMSLARERFLLNDRKALLSAIADFRTEKIQRVFIAARMLGFAHWIGICIEHMDDNTDHIIILDSLNKNRKSSKTVEAIYQLFATDNFPDNADIPPIPPSMDDL
jgi:hypothetical protein